MKTRFQIFAFLAALVGAVTIVSPYSLTGGKWATHELPYYINPANNHMSEADAIAAIQAAATGWIAQSSANIVPNYMGRTSGTSLTNNGRNEIFFRNTSNGSLYGETYWWFGSNSQLIDADTVFYTGSVRFFSDAMTCSGTGTYLQDAATHEFGHVLGVGHSSLSAASMYPTMTWCSKSFRSLDSDDVAAIEKLYPPGAVSNTAPTVSISSPTNGSSAVEGASISFTGSASDKEDGAITGYLVWRSSINGQIGTGGSFARSLSAGSHTITATVTDSRGVASSQQIGLVVTSPTTVISPSSISLSARGYKVKGSQRVDLTWSGATTSSIVIVRNGSQVMVTANDGRETDPVNQKGGGSYTYKVCASGTSICSSAVTVSF
jgi:hypothetical protein